MKMHMYVAEVSDKIANDIPKRIFPKMSRNKSFYFIARFEAIYSFSKTRVPVLAIGFRFTNS